MGNSTSDLFSTETTADTPEQKGITKRTMVTGKQADPKSPSAWRDTLKENSVVRVWDTVFQTSYPAVVTRVDDRNLGLKFCPKYPDGTYCKCVVEQKTAKDAKIVNPYLSTRKDVKKQSSITAACRTESLDHLSDMIWAGENNENKDKNLVLTQGLKAPPPPVPPSIQKMNRYGKPQRLESIDEC